LPTPLTAKERKTNRASLSFLKGMIHMKGKPYHETFCKWAEESDPEDCAATSSCCSKVDGHPGHNSKSDLTFDVIVKELMTVPEREEKGTIRRLGDLGYFIFNDLLWNEDWKTFPIGADFADHRKNRPFADLLMGSKSPAWNREMIKKSVQEFFEKRTSMTSADHATFVTKLFHKILLDMDISEVEVADFEAYKASAMMISLLPRWLVSSLRWAFSLSTARENRDLWLEKYEHAIKNDKRGIIPPVEGRDRRFLADLLLTSMTSAGGLSVPSLMGIVLAVVYGGENSPLPSSQRKITKNNLEQLVLETVRRFPVVVGFPMWKPDMSKRHVLNLAMALRDHRKWSDPLEFKLRPLSEYHEKVGSGTKIGLAWAEQGKGPEGFTQDSRGCPGQELSVVMITEFFRAMIPMQDEWTVTEMPSGGVTITEGPCAASSFTLSRGADPSKPPTINDKDCDSELTAEERDVADESGVHCQKPEKPDRPGFTCPAECEECCKKIIDWSFVFGRQDTTKFKCIMPKEKMGNAKTRFKIVGRKCEDPKIRNSRPGQAKAECDFTQAEQDFKMYDDVKTCSK